MKNLFETIRKYLNWKTILLALVILIIVYFVFIKKSPLPTYETTTMSKQDIQNLVEVAGSVTSENDRQLSFLSSGKVKKVYFKEGDKVSSGDLIIELDDSDVNNQIAQAVAALEISKSQLAKLKDPIKPEEKKVLDVQVNNSKLSYENMKKNLDETKKTNTATLKEAELAVKNAEEIYNATLNANNQTADADIKSFENTLQNAKTNLENIKKANDKAITTAQSSLDQAKIALENAKSSLNVNNPIYEKNLADSQENSFYSVVKYYDEVDKTLQAVNYIVTIEDINKDANAAYKDLLGIKKQNSYSTLDTNYRDLRKSYNDNKDLFIITKRDLSYDDIISRLSKLKSILDQSYGLLNNAMDVLDNSQTSVNLTDSKLSTFKDSIISQRQSVTNAISGIATTLQSVENFELQKKSNVTSLDNAVKSAEAALNTAEDNYNQTLQTVENQKVTAENNVSQAEKSLEQAKAGTLNKDINVISARNNYENAKQSLASLKQKNNAQIVSLDKSVDDASSQMILTESQRLSQTSPAKQTDLNVGQSQVVQQEANLNSAKKKKDDLKIFAPIDGIIGKIDAKEEEAVSPGKIVVVVLMKDLKNIETLVSETEINDVKIGQKVKFDFDAFKETDIYTGEVSFIDTDATVKDGVIYYKVKISFNPNEYKDNIVKSSMTTNLKIVTSEVLGVDAIPKSAVKENTKDNYFYVEILNSKKEVEKKQIEMGIKGDEYVEVISGLTSNDNVILSVNKNGTNG